MTETKKRILEHALQAFLEAPYSRISIREIAVRSGVSHTYIHKAFGGKSGLYKSVALEAARAWSSSNNIGETDTPAEVILKTFASTPYEQPVMTLIRKAMTEVEARDLLLDTFWRDNNLAVEPLRKVTDSMPDTVTIEFSRESLQHLLLLLIWLPTAAELLSMFAESKSPAKQDLLIAVMKPLLYGKTP